MGKELKPFRVRDCALISIATGKKAYNLRELKDIISDISPESIYYHFWGVLMNPRYLNREYNNDFAIWAKHSLHDSILAERLSVIDPVEFEIDGLRCELIDIIEERLDEEDWLNFVKPEEKFHFIRSDIIVFDTERSVGEIDTMADEISKMSQSSIFYHFVDARRRTPDKIDDFRAWLSGIPEDKGKISAKIAELDPFFVSLPVLREQLVNIFSGRKALEGGKNGKTA